MPHDRASNPPATAPERPSILLDCDPGHDDVIAIVAAAHHANLIAITTVSGNAPLDRTTHNALVMRDLLALDVPVHSGTDRPIMCEPQYALNIHGESGLDGADLPEPTTPLDGTDAVGFIIETCRASEGLWLVPTGPLTNIALAIRNAPDIVSRVRGVSLMGGGSFGNRSALAEFNIWADPHAAHIVFGSGVPLTMAGLDVTHQFLATQPRIETIRAIGGQLATVLSDLLTFFSATYADLHDADSWPGGAVHDPLAVLAVTHPNLFESVARHVDVETTGELTRGMTVIDERTTRSRQPANCDVLTSVDADRGFAVIADAVSHFSK